MKISENNKKSVQENFKWNSLKKKVWINGEKSFFVLFLLIVTLHEFLLAWMTSSELQGIYLFVFCFSFSRENSTSNINSIKWVYWLSILFFIQLSSKKKRTYFNIKLIWNADEVLIWILLTGKCYIN